MKSLLKIPSTFVVAFLLGVGTYTVISVLVKLMILERSPGVSSTLVGLVALITAIWMLRRRSD
jgi:hypothetical protein